MRRFDGQEFWAALSARLVEFRGEEVIVGQDAHTYRYEGGGAAVLGSIQPQPLANLPDGTLDLAMVEAAIKPDDSHFAITRLLALENTIGGKVIGNINATNKIELQSGSHIEGDIHTHRLVIDEGVFFEGSCKMGGTPVEGETGRSQQTTGTQTGVTGTAVGAGKPPVRDKVGV
jgi:hypothetical protein